MCKKQQRKSREEFNLKELERKHHKNSGYLPAHVAKRLEATPQKNTLLEQRQYKSRRNGLT
ncbi:MAG: hypothetical protein ACR5K4_02820 [Sodalis sp. (in: enterobacteria)]